MEPSGSGDATGNPSLTVLGVYRPIISKETWREQWLVTGDDDHTKDLLNSDFAGSSGTWASSDSTVVFVNQKGYAWSLSPGTAIITYRSPSGIRFNERIMYIDAFN